MTSIITVYGRENCQPCRATKWRLDALAIPYRAVEINKLTAAVLHELGFQELPVVQVTRDCGCVDRWSGHRPDLLDQLAADPLF